MLVLPPPLIRAGGDRALLCWLVLEGVLVETEVELGVFTALALVVGADEAEVAEDDVETGELMLSFLPKVADEETIIFLKFDVIDSDETNELAKDD